MNLEKNPSVSDLRHLLEHCDDQAGHHVLWVAKNGDVRVSRVPKDKAPTGYQNGEPDMQIRYETFEAGNGYVGIEAADDESWVKELFETLVNKWPKAKGKPTVEYVDQL